MTRMASNVATWCVRVSGLAIAVLGTAVFLFGTPADHPPSDLIGLWRGTSVCTDRVAAPACKDEVVVYEFTAGTDDDTVHWQADKVVDEKRLNMGEIELKWDQDDDCWRGEFEGPRVHTMWCVRVKGHELTGSGWLLPGKQTVRKIEASRDFGESPHRKK
jgi:hypothetical protein